MKYPTWIKSFVTLILLLVGFAPVLIYLWISTRTPILTVESGLAVLNDPGQNAILVDVRSREEFSAVHLAGSLNWPAAEIASLDSSLQIPADFQGRPLLLICNSGFQSALSGEKLRSLGVNDVYYIRGGLQSWIGISNSSSPYAKVVFPSAGTSIHRPMTLFEQTAAVVSGFGFKPLHMMLSAVLGIVLLRQRAADLRLFGWGIVIFLAAETFCAINYLFYNHNSYLAEYLHSYGMALSFGFTAFALMLGTDDRLLKLSASDKRCLFLPLCRECAKYNQGSCKMRTLLQLLTVALAILAFIPLLTAPIQTSYLSDIFGTTYHYCRLLLSQYFEGRYLPLVSIVFCLGAPHRHVATAPEATWSNLTMIWKSLAVQFRSVPERVPIHDWSLSALTKKVLVTCARASGSTNAASATSSTSPAPQRRRNAAPRVPARCAVAGCPVVIMRSMVGRTFHTGALRPAYVKSLEIAARPAC